MGSVAFREAGYQTLLEPHPTMCHGLGEAEAEVPWGEPAPAVFPHGRMMIEGTWVPAGGRLEWAFGGQHCGPWAIGWAWVSWVAGLSSKQSFAWFQGPEGVLDSIWLLLLS